MALVWKSREFFCYDGARPIKFVAGWRDEKLGWPRPPNAGEQLKFGQALAECATNMGVKSRDNGVRSKVRGTFANSEWVGDFYGSRVFEFRKLSFEQILREPILILEFAIRVACLAVRGAEIWRPPPIFRRWKGLRARILVRWRHIFIFPGLAWPSFSFWKFRLTRGRLTRLRLKLTQLRFRR